MAALTSDLDVVRQPSEYVNYTGISWAAVYKGALLMTDGANGVRPAARGITLAHFVGVADNRVYPGSANGVSNDYIRTWKSGEFTYTSQGTGSTTDIGKNVYVIDDQTVGTSVAEPTFVVGEVIAIPTTSTYRVRINNAIGSGYRGFLLSGASGSVVLPYNQN